jgi:hypothetical protein
MFQSYSNQIKGALRAVTSRDDGLHEGNAGLFEFAEGLLYLDAQRDGFAGPDVESVEAMWGYADANFFWDGGYVVRLRDGRRAYIGGRRFPNSARTGRPTSCNGHSMSGSSRMSRTTA